MVKLIESFVEWNYFVAGFTRVTGLSRLTVTIQFASSKWRQTSVKSRYRSNHQIEKNR